MTKKEQKAIKKISDACKDLGWDMVIQGEDNQECVGMIIGKSDYVTFLTGFME